jgi:hypothetical protein
MMDEARLLLAVIGAFALGWLLGAAREVHELVSLLRALEAADIDIESKGDLAAILKEDE